mgnify:FL=1
MRFVFIEVEKRDTLLVFQTDTAYREKIIKTETVKEKKRLGNEFFYTSGWVLWIVILGVGIWFLYKVKKNEK